MINRFDVTQYPPREPLRVLARDRWVWKREDISNAYPSPIYNLSYRFTNQEDTAEVQEAFARVVDGVYVVELEASQTEEFSAGTWTWEAVVFREADASEVVAAKGSLHVTSATETSHVQRVLTALEATLEGKAGDDILEIEIAGRQLVKMAPGELLMWRNKYKAELATIRQADRVAAGLGSSRKIRARIR